MPRFFTDDIRENTGIISGADAAHISRSLRMKPGDEVVICDLKGRDYHCVIRTVDIEQVVLDIKSEKPVISEPDVKLRLFQAMPKGDKLEYIVQKAVELGATEIIPVLTERCISRPDEKAMDKKIKRLNKIAFEAAKQSGRGILPRVGKLLSYNQAVESMKDDELSLLFYEKAAVSVSKIITKEVLSVSIMIGSEGGFSPAEADFAASEGLKCASLGPRILRCETAPICAISVIMYALGQI